MSNKTELSKAAPPVPPSRPTSVTPPTNTTQDNIIRKQSTDAVSQRPTKKAPPVPPIGTTPGMNTNQDSPQRLSTPPSSGITSNTIDNKQQSGNGGSNNFTSPRGPLQRTPSATPPPAASVNTPQADAPTTQATTTTTTTTTTTDKKAPPPIPPRANSKSNLPRMIIKRDDTATAGIAGTNQTDTDSNSDSGGSSNPPTPTIRSPNSSVGDLDSVPLDAKLHKSLPVPDSKIVSQSPPRKSAPAPLSKIDSSAGADNEFEGGNAGTQRPKSVQSRQLHKKSAIIPKSGETLMQAASHANDNDNSSSRPNSTNFDLSSGPPAPLPKITKTDDSSRKSTPPPVPDKPLNISSAVRAERLSKSPPTSPPISPRGGPNEATATAQQPSPTPSPPPPMTPEEEEAANFSYRTNIVKEIQKTEQFYVKGLTNMTKIFLMPLRESALRGNPADQLMSTEELKSVFSNVEVLLNINRQFLSELDKALETWSPQSKIGHVFLSIVPFLKVYIVYINNYNHAMTSYEKCMSRKSFRKFMDDVTKLPGMDLNNLPSYLITPIQRIPRYQLLVTELIKKTSHDHPDFKDLESALQKIQAVAEEINAQKRDAENLNKVAEIQRNLIWPEDCRKKSKVIVTTIRRFVREGELEIQIGGVVSKYNYLFIFNDALIIAKQKSKGFLFHSFHYLRKLTIAETSTKEEVNDGNLVYRLRPAVTITSASKPFSCVVSFQNNEERSSWMVDLNKKDVPELRDADSDVEDAPVDTKKEKTKKPKMKREKSSKDVKKDLKKGEGDSNSDIPNAPPISNSPTVTPVQSPQLERDEKKILAQSQNTTRPAPAKEGARPGRFKTLGSADRAKLKEKGSGPGFNDDMFSELSRVIAKQSVAANSKPPPENK